MGLSLKKKGVGAGQLEVRTLQKASSTTKPRGTAVWGRLGMLDSLAEWSLEWRGLGAGEAAGRDWRDALESEYGLVLRTVRQF